MSEGSRSSGELDAYRPAGLVGSAVLVVEPDPERRSRLASGLTQLGYRVLQGSDAGSARRVVLSETLDAVLLNLDLGEEEAGFELLGWCHQARPEVPLVALAGSEAAPGEVRRAYEAGATAYFVTDRLPLEVLYSDLAARVLEGGRARLQTT